MKPKPQKKKFEGPKINLVDFDALFLACQAEADNLYEAPVGGDDLLAQTTLMLKNIPVRFNQHLMLQLIDEKFAGCYDYFYLPKDLKTQGSVGFAFINFVHPVCILRFYHEFQGAFWSALIEGCNSPKKC